MNLSGKTIGHIEIKKLIGKGGMGEVYEGLDSTLKRRVAVKVIASGKHKDSRSLSRFLREAQALSKLNHPNICQVYDYIKEDGTHFIVLEYIRGRNLQQAVRTGLDKHQKFRVALEIAQVLKAAHEKGIIHRDLKPSNVMLTEENSVKVLDFGLARFVRSKYRSRSAEVKPLILPYERQEHEKVDSPHTLTITPPDPGDACPQADESRELSFPTEGGSIMGTPLYMSPEQARGEAVDTASDMYSYGLLLQELYTEQSPHEDTVDSLELIQKARAGQSRPITGVRSDLAALINRLKSLSPAARPTALETVKILQQIQKKPIRRARQAIAAAVLLAFTLFGFKYTMDLRKERREAIQARDEATSVVRFLVNLFQISDPGEARGNTITAREILERGASEIQMSLADQPLIRARMMETIGTVYRKLGLYKEAEPLLKKAVELCEKELGSTDPRVAESLVSYAEYCIDTGNVSEAEQNVLHSLEIQEGTLRRDHSSIAESYLALGRIGLINGKFEEAESLIRKSLNINEETLGPNHPDIAVGLVYLGQSHYVRRQFAEAEQCYKRALDIQEKNLAEGHPDLSKTMKSLANLYFMEQRYDEAEKIYRQHLDIQSRVLGDIHPEVADLWENIGALYHYRNDLDTALNYYEKALEIRKTSLGENNPEVAASYDAIARIYHSQQKYEEAASFYKEAIRILEVSLGEKHIAIPERLHNLALLYTSMGKMVEAEQLHRKGLTISRETWGQDHIRTTRSLEALGYFYMASERYKEAVEMYRQADLILSREKRSTEFYAQLLSDLGRCYVQLKQNNSAKDALERSWAIVEIQRDIRSVVKARILYNFAFLYHKGLNDLQEAESYYIKTLALQDEVQGHDHPETQETVAGYAALLHELGRSDEAERLVSGKR